MKTINRNLLLPFPVNIGKQKSIFRLSIILILLMGLLSQCAVTRPSMSTGIVDKVALMATIVNFQQPTGINGPTGIARSQFKNRATDINQIMSNNVDSLHRAVAQNLRKQLGCEVLTGEELHALPKYNELKTKLNNSDALIKEDEKFPEVLISSGDINFMIKETKGGPLNGGRAVPVTPEELRETIKKLCIELNVKHIAFAEFVFTGSRTGLIFPTNTFLIYTLNLYNQNGELIAYGQNTESTVELLEIDLTGSFRTMIKSFIEKSEIIELKSVFAKK
jgi:hypothetical protein